MIKMGDLPHESERKFPVDPGPHEAERKRAAQLIQEAICDAEVIRTQAEEYYQRGYADGFEQSKAEAIALEMKWSQELQRQMEDTKAQFVARFVELLEINEEQTGLSVSAIEQKLSSFFATILSSRET